MGYAALVLLDASESDYDRNAYPEAKSVAIVASEHPSLTQRLMANIPKAGGVIFKLASDADRDIIARVNRLERRTSYLSFTSELTHENGSGVTIAATATDEMFNLFRLLDHSRAWLQPLLTAERAFTCAVAADGVPASVCFAYENCDRVWEIGGVVTSPAYRGRGLASRVVRGALAELRRRQLVSRYQVNETNLASIQLAQSIRMTHFLTLTHYLRA